MDVSYSPDEILVVKAPASYPQYLREQDPLAEAGSHAQPSPPSKQNGCATNGFSVEHHDMPIDVSLYSTPSKEDHEVEDFEKVARESAKCGAGQELPEATDVTNRYEQSLEEARITEEGGYETELRDSDKYQEPTPVVDRDDLPTDEKEPDPERAAPEIQIVPRQESEHHGYNEDEELAESGGSFTSGRETLPQQESEGQCKYGEDKVQRVLAEASSTFGAQEEENPRSEVVNSESQEAHDRSVCPAEHYLNADAKASVEEGPADAVKEDAICTGVAAELEARSSDPDPCKVEEAIEGPYGSASIDAEPPESPYTHHCDSVGEYNEAAYGIKQSAVGEVEEKSCEVADAPSVESVQDQEKAEVEDQRESGSVQAEAACDESEDVKDKSLCEVSKNEAVQTEAAAKEPEVTRTEELQTDTKAKESEFAQSEATHEDGVFVEDQVGCAESEAIAKDNVPPEEDQIGYDPSEAVQGQKIEYSQSEKAEDSVFEEEKVENVQSEATREDNVECSEPEVAHEEKIEYAQSEKTEDRVCEEEKIENVESEATREDKVECAQPEAAHEEKIEYDESEKVEDSVREEEKIENVQSEVTREDKVECAQPEAAQEEKIEYDESEKAEDSVCEEGKIENVQTEATPEDKVECAKPEAAIEEKIECYDESEKAEDSSAREVEKIEYVQSEATREDEVECAQPEAAHEEKIENVQSEATPEDKVECAKREAAIAEKIEYDESEKSEDSACEEEKIENVQSEATPEDKVECAMGEAAIAEKIEYDESEKAEDSACEEEKIENVQSEGTPEDKVECAKREAELEEKIEYDESEKDEDSACEEEKIESEATRRDKVECSPPEAVHEEKIEYDEFQSAVPEAKYKAVDVKIEEDQSKAIYAESVPEAIATEHGVGHTEDEIGNGGAETVEEVAICDKQGVTKTETEAASSDSQEECEKVPEASPHKGGFFEKLIDKVTGKHK